MIPITRPELPPLEDYEALLAEIWESRMLSNFGYFAQRLELLATEYVGVPCRVVASGDIGLILTIAALDLPNGTAVVVPSFTFSSTVNAVLWNGLRPVFADIDPATFNLDPISADAAVSQFGAEAIVATHVFGNPADVDGLTAVAEKHQTRLMFDAAHAYGAEREGRKVGLFGAAEVFSLSGTKLVTTGEGGLISSADPAVLERITYLRGYGFLGDYNSRWVGMNGKMSELHAALGTLTLKRIDDAVAGRHAMVEEYTGRLAGAPLAFQAVSAGDRSTYKDFAVLFDSNQIRKAAERTLADAGIQTKRYFLPCHTQQAYRDASRVPLPNTESVYSRILCLPMFRSMTLSDIDRVIEGVLDACA